MDASRAREQLVRAVQQVGSLQLLPRLGEGLGALHVLHLHLGETPCEAVHGGDGLDEGEVLRVQLQGLPVGLHRPLRAATPHQGFRLAGELLDAHAPQGIDLGAHAVADDIGRTHPVEAGGTAGWTGRRNARIRNHSHALQLSGQAVGQGGIPLLGSQSKGVLQGVHLLHAVATLVGQLRQEDPGFGSQGVLQGRPQAVGDGVPTTAARQLPSDGGEEPETFLGPISLRQVPQGLLAQGQGLLW